MATFAAYSTETGRIDHIRDSDIARMQYHSLPTGHLFAAYVDPNVSPETHYVLDGVVKAKLPLVGVETEYTIAADGIDVVAFSLPAGTVVVFQGAEHTGEEEFRFSSDIPGDYHFELRPPAEFLDMEVVIHGV